MASALSRDGSLGKAAEGTQPLWLWLLWLHSSLDRGLRKSQNWESGNNLEEDVPSIRELQSACNYSAI
jgi:hypothetical protein